MSGTSMVCQMLAAGGLRVAGQWPSYETPEPWLDAEWQAAKLLDPHRAPLGWWLAGALVIWLDRDPMQQARSQVKLLGETFRCRTEARAFANRLRKDRKRALMALRGARLDPLMWNFEQVLASPFLHAAALTRFVSIDGGGNQPFDTGKAAAAVLRRDSDCLPGLALEAHLLKAGGPQGVAR